MVHSIARTVRLPIAVALLIIGFACGVIAADVQTPSCTTALFVIDVQQLWVNRLWQTADGVYITDKLAAILPLAREAGVHIAYI